jgi:hypothetical protein
MIDTFATNFELVFFGWKHYNCKYQARFVALFFSRSVYSTSTQKAAIQNRDNIPIIRNANKMNFSKTAPANLPSYASHLSLIYFYLLFISYLIHPLPNPVSSLAGRAPPYGGIARPKGKHSRHKGVLCLPPLIFRLE